MAEPTGRSTLAQLTTARLLLAQFREQLREWRGMPVKKRRGTARGRDLARRLDGLNAGEAKWSARVVELEAQLQAEASQVDGSG